MDDIQCSIDIDKEKKQINFQGLPETDLQIDFNNDVDFTKLVSTLTKLIDKSKRVVFSTSQTDMDEKLKLIVETISGIIDKYNESVSADDLKESEVNSQDDDLPF